MSLLKKLSGFLERWIGDKEKAEKAQKWLIVDLSEFGY